MPQILKPLEEPLKIKQLQALENRLVKDHEMHEKVMIDLLKEKKGYRGHLHIDFPLKFLPKKEFLILHDLRIPDENGFFQMDTLLINKKFILILEVKNWDGIFLFDENGQVIRTDLTKEEGYKNPIPQAKLQMHRLNKWLSSQKITSIPLDFLIVYSFPTTIIKKVTQQNPDINRVIHNDELLSRIHDLTVIHKDSNLKMNKLKQLSSKLVKAHTTKKIDIFGEYHISYDDLIKGVECPSCGHLPMERKFGSWFCHNCNHSSKHAHKSAMNDYYLLVNDFITNGESRDFLQLKSSNVAKRLLQQGKFDTIGDTSSRRYRLELR